MSVLDEYLKEDGIILYNQRGEEKEFIVIAGISTETGFYLVMQPAILPSDKYVTDLMVFEVKESETDENNLTLVTDEEIIKEVLTEYYALPVDENDYED